MQRRTKVPSFIVKRSKLSSLNLSSDKMSDVKKFYGWSEKQLEQQVRLHTNEAGDGLKQREYYEQIYAKKE